VIYDRGQGCVEDAESHFGLPHEPQLNLVRNIDPQDHINKYQSQIDYYLKVVFPAIYTVRCFFTFGIVGSFIWFVGIKDY
jgi:hypothetical protein